MATKFSPFKGSYVLNQFPSNVMFGMNGFHLSASGAIQGHHGPLVFFSDVEHTEITVQLFTTQCTLLMITVRERLTLSQTSPCFCMSADQVF